MGFSIDEIIGNGETTQRFMRVVLEKVEEQEAIDIELLSPMVRAELLPDHSMAITFGGITEEEKKGMFGKILDMMNQLSGKMTHAEKDAIPEAEENSTTEKADFENGFTSAEEDEVFKESTQLALGCNSVEDAIRISKLFLGKDKVPGSSLYKLEEKYFLVMEFMGFSKQEMKPLAFFAVEYENRRVATAAGIAYIKEHGKCIMAQEALSDLMQL